MLPPFLIAGVAGLVLAYRGAQSEWDGLALPGLSAVASAGPSAVAAKPTPPKAEVVVVPPKPKPEPAPAALVAAVVPRPAPEIEAKRADAAKAKVWDDIALEAQRARDQQAELERIKADEDARAAAAPPPVEHGRRRGAKVDLDAILKAQMQVHRRLQQQLERQMLEMQRRPQAQAQADAMRRSWVNGGNLPDRMGGRPGVPFPPRPMPPGGTRGTRPSPTWSRSKGRVRPGCRPSSGRSGGRGT